MLMDLAAMLVAALLGVALLAIAIAHLLWGLGIRWPIRDEAVLASALSGAPGAARMPPWYRSLAIALLAFAACVVAFSVADHTAGGPPLTALALLAGILFLARGALGYTAWWRERTPGEPYRTLDRRNYSPLCLALGVGFVALVIMRLT
jgi:hypothetical protein